eukprot:CAMPEP_0113464604 /NCGR_PEP_ID=MMETSP0014_2-20120614/13288_1 /TAXON_ID=2857 /ORGANISM="Nitzschia sp." /LENGTH=539 /DNA_ID=CAMNT_0000356693 /DNA_START=91 /DNA_END=1710 /DNA_ORIENTATION=- /assembly_acc=CAM_ASM_000159
MVLPRHQPLSCSLLRRPMLLLLVVVALLSSSSSSTSTRSFVEASTFRDMTARSYLCDNNLNEIEKPLPISSWDPKKAVRICVRRNPNIHMDIFIHEISTYSFKKEEVDPTDRRDTYIIQQLAIKDATPVDYSSTKLDCKTGASLCSLETTLKEDFFSSDGKITGTGTVALRYGKFQNNNYEDDASTSTTGNGGSRKGRSLRARREQEQEQDQEQRELISFAGYIDVELEIETTTDPIGNTLQSVYGTVTGTNGEWVTVPLLRTTLIILLIVLALCFCCCAVASFCRGRRDKVERRKEREEMMIDRASRHSSTHSKHVRIAKTVTKKPNSTHNSRRVSSSASSASSDGSDATFAEDDLSSRMSLTPSQHSRRERPSSHKSPRRLSKSPRRISDSPRRLSKSPRRLSDSPRRLSEQRQGRTSLDSSSQHSRRSVSSTGKKSRQLRKAPVGSSPLERRQGKTSLDSASQHSRRSTSSTGTKPRQLRRASMGSSAHTSRSSSSFGKKASERPQKMQQAKSPSPKKTKKGPTRKSDSTLLSRMV